MAFTISASDRGMFDPAILVFPQGMFDINIFDSNLVESIDRIVLPIFVHGTSEITVLVHGNEVITLK